MIFSNRSTFYYYSHPSDLLNNFILQVATLWSLELADEGFDKYFAYDFCGEDSDSALIRRAKFQKENGCGWKLIVASSIHDNQLDQ